MSARLPEAFRAGALAAIPSIRPFQARRLPKPPVQAELADFQVGYAGWPGRVPGQPELARSPLTSKFRQALMRLVRFRVYG